MEPRATAIIIGGGDTTPEEHYFATGAAAVRRGYNALLVEIPGQRGAYYSDPDLTYRPDTDVQLRYIVDYAVNRADVKPEHLGSADARRIVLCRASSASNVADLFLA